MQHTRSTVFALALVGMASITTVASAEPAAYDPVARAIALGLTAEIYDAAFDRALAAAEQCDAGAVALQTMACAPRQYATVDAVAEPPLGS
jgi:hypothetical protein